MSAAQKQKLREDLARHAGIPRDICNNPASVWDKSVDQIKQSFEMDGAVLKLVPPRKKSSGKAIVYDVEHSGSGIKQFEYHPGGGEHGSEGMYYKIVKTDGTQIRVIDPSEKIDPKTISKEQIYLNPQGQELMFKNGKWVIK